MNYDLEREAKRIGAVPADIPGLWWAPGYPELTTGQLIQVLGDRRLDAPTNRS